MLMVALQESGQSVRYKATIRSTALTLTATNSVQLSFPAISGGELCIRPIAIRLAVFGTRVDPLQHVMISRKAILDPNRVATVTKALTELLMLPNITPAHRDMAVDVLQSIIGGTKNAAAQLGSGTILESLISHGILRCAGAQPSSTVGLLHKVLEIAPKMKANISAACMALLPNLLELALSPLRVMEFFELTRKVSSSNSADVAVCSSQGR